MSDSLPRLSGPDIARATAALAPSLLADTAAITALKSTAWELWTLANHARQADLPNVGRLCGRVAVLAQTVGRHRATFLLRSWAYEYERLTGKPALLGGTREPNTEATGDEPGMADAPLMKGRS